MKRCLRISLFLLITGLSLSVQGQDIPIDTWRYHLSYQRARLVTGGEGAIFCAAENGLFAVIDSELRLISKNEGLSNVAPGAITYDASSETLIVGYANSVIDFVSPNGVVVVDDLSELDFGVPTGVNEMTVSNQTLYAGTDFGVIAITLEDKSLTQIFSEIGPEGATVAVHDLIVQGDSIYAMGDFGILVGDLGDNLLDFNNWLLIEESGLEGMARFNQQVLTYRGRNLYTVDLADNSLSRLVSVPFDIVDVADQGSQIYILGARSLRLWSNTSNEIVTIELQHEAREVLPSGDDLWIADVRSGLIRKTGNTEERIIPNGPAADDITHIKFENDLYAFYAHAPGESLIDSSGYSSFRDQRWVNDTIPGFYNISDVGTLNGEILLSSNGFGVVNRTASTVLSLELPDDADVPALLTRDDGTWVLVYDDEDALLFLQEDGTILRFASTVVGGSQYTFLQQSTAGTLWLGRAKAASGLQTYNPIENLDRRITTTDELPSNVIRDLVIDLEDEAWIATTGGLAVFPDASFVFDEFGAILPIFDNDILLEGEEITAITVDGGNRKWVGTNDGLWVFNSAIDNLDHRFTAENSPLLDNKILELAYDPEKGEMFILTAQGLCSYQTGSSAGEPTHRNVSIFPNPVYPEHVGLVTFKGLARDAIIKVTDINGRLVAEQEALGGTATWDLRDATGSQVVGGVYLLFSSTADGEDTFVGKVAVIR